MADEKSISHSWGPGVQLCVSLDLWIFYSKIRTFPPMSHTTRELGSRSLNFNFGDWKRGIHFTTTNGRGNTEDLTSVLFMVHKSG